MKKILISLLLFCFSFSLFAGSDFKDSFNQSKIDKYLRDFNTHINFVSLDEAENTVIEQSNDMRSYNNYYDGYFYIIETIIQSNFGTVALAKNDVNLGEKWHRRAIETLMSGKKEHHKILKSEKATKELWANIGMSLFSVVMNSKLIETGYTGQMIVPQWIELDVDKTKIPVSETMEGYYGNDIKRFPVIPGYNFLSAIGRIKSEDGSCTGSVVSPRIILTNWHCTGNKLSVNFEKLYETKSYKVTRYLTYKGWDIPYNEKENQDDGFKNDWALLVLDTEVEGGSLRIQSRFTKAMLKSMRRKLFIAGYSADIQNGTFLTADYGCSASDIVEPINGGSGILKVDCRKDRGSSGSPILIAGTNRIVALNAFGSNGVNSQGQKNLCINLKECSGGGPDMRIISKELRKIRKMIINGEI